MVCGCQVCPIARGDSRLVGGRQIARGPRLARQRRRFDAPASGGQRFGQSRAAIAGARFVGAEESDHRRAIFAGTHLALGDPAQAIVVGPVGVGVEEAGVIGERIAVARAQPPPVGDGIVDLGLRHPRRGINRRILRGVSRLGHHRPGRRCEQHQQNCGLSHAGQNGGSILISL